MKNFTKPFENLSKSDAGIAGGKGASLGEMTVAGIPVPSGFVVLADAFERFCEETDLDVEIDSILHKVDHKEIHTVDGASEKIKALILEAKMPDDIAKEIKSEFKKLGAEFVAVRSSATAEDSSEAAWAGQLDSFLNTKEKDLLEKVQRCWASLFTPRAIFYRFEKGLHGTYISVAVVVQKMVESEVSGIAFSVHPVTEDYNQLIIEAGFGLGEAIVSGQITPDSYVVEKTPRRIIDKNISEQERGLYKIAGGGNEWKDLGERGKAQKLSDEQVLELSELILKIEKHYGFPCDIEWAYERGKFFITQSRPITTLSQQKTQEKEVWVNNASVERCGYQLISPAMGLGMDWGVKAIMGKNSRYLTERFYYFQGVNMKGMYYLESDLANFANNILEIIYKKPSFIEKNHKESYKFNDILFKHSTNLAKKDFSKLSNKQLAKEYIRFTNIQEKAHAHSLGTTWFVDSTGGVFANRLLEETKKIVEERKSSLNPAEVWTTLTTPEKNSFAIQEELDSFKVLEIILKEKKAKTIFEKLRNYDELPNNLSLNIKKAIINHKNKWSWTPFGYLGPAYGIDYYLSIWSGLVREKIDPKKEIQKILNRIGQIKKNKKSILKSLKISSKEKRIYDIAADVTFLKGYRKDCSYIGFYAFGKMVPEIAKSLGINDADVYLLTYKEIAQLLASNKKADKNELNKRKEHAVMLMKNGEIEVVSGQEALDFINSHNIKKEEIVLDSNSLKGNCACAGKARGIVKIVNTPEEMGKMNQGDIMVSHTTFPALVPAMKKAAAIVTEDGGITCHAAIVARELKTPCVTGIKVITKVVKDGDEVEVDADNGVVRIIKNEKSTEFEINDSDYYKNLKLKKMGRWATMLADTDTWHTASTSNYFEKKFGIWREILGITFLDKGIVDNHMYTTWRFTEKLHSRIKELTAKDEKGLEKILLDFYKERVKIKKEIAKINPKDFHVVSNDQLIKIYQENRDRVHFIVSYDQFTWLAEEYWIPLMDEIIIKKAGLKKDSKEYNNALFALIKPREISTTLTERRIVIEKALIIKNQKGDIKKIASNLAKEFGWMPVMAYGTPWDIKKYIQELEENILKDNTLLEKELAELKDYTKIRDKNLNSVVKKYKITKKDLQIFIDFGLAIDVRNESEYVASFGGFYLLPIYNEICRRLNISITELRTLFEDEIVACLKGKQKVSEILKVREKKVAWGLNSDTKSRVVFSGDEVDELFSYAENQNNYLGSSDNAKLGITANKGKVRGIARLVPSPDYNYKIKEGDVLFAYSTMVDNLPAMKKAVAFVTESGGLTCHAAVVAREFGVPCIVGLRGAMSDFKDGDLVEVDADNGTVKKIVQSRPITTLKK